MNDYYKIFNNLWYAPENEVIEFKEAKESFDIDDLGKYFSAMSNEANLRGMDFAWLVFGVSDNKRLIVGTNFKNGSKALHKLKNDMSQHTTGNHIFREIAQIMIEGKRLLIFQIPATPRNIVMCWKNIPYARNGESLKPLDQGKQDEIRNQSPIRDWSLEIVPDATLDDLDELALAKARIEYAKVHKEHISREEIEGWTKEEFLKNSEVMRDGGLTRAALLLLGKASAVGKLLPAVAQISWVLNDEEGNPVDYEHFTIPYILTVDKVLGKVRNLTMREMPGGTLFPDVAQQYDNYTMREALHNSIAHMDYRLEERITVVENPGFLCYANGGIFAPGTVDDVLKHIGPQRYYRNRCLCNAMVHYNMIDTIGRGIRKMYSKQRERFFPMPDYEIDNEKKEVVVKIYGKAIDEKYTQLLKENHNLSLQECIWLDAIQKGNPITRAAISHLKDKGLVEGRTPHLTISLGIAQLTHQLPHYNKVKGLEKSRLAQMVEQLIGSAQNGVTRKEIMEYVSVAMPAGRTEQQKLRILGNLLSEMQSNGVIVSDKRHWMLKENN